MFRKQNSFNKFIERYFFLRHYFLVWTNFGGTWKLSRQRIFWKENYIQLIPSARAYSRIRNCSINLQNVTFFEDTKFDHFQRHLKTPPTMNFLKRKLYSNYFQRVCLQCDSTNCISVVVLTISPWHGAFQGRARTQSPTNKNDAPELPTLGVIDPFSPTLVQWKSLGDEELPCGSQYPLSQVSMPKQCPCVVCECLLPTHIYDSPSGASEFRHVSTQVC